MSEMHFDAGRCAGTGHCHAIAPVVFELDDTGFLLAPPRMPIDESLRHAAGIGAAACPRRAITIADSRGGERLPENVIEFRPCAS